MLQESGGEFRVLVEQVFHVGRLHPAPYPLAQVIEVGALLEDMPDCLDLTALAFIILSPIDSV